MGTGGTASLEDFSVIVYEGFGPAVPGEQKEHNMVTLYADEDGLRRYRESLGKLGLPKQQSDVPQDYAEFVARMMEEHAQQSAEVMEFGAPIASGADLCEEAGEVEVYRAYVSEFDGPAARRAVLASQDDQREHAADRRLHACEKQSSLSKLGTTNLYDPDNDPGVNLAGESEEEAVWQP